MKQNELKRPFFAGLLETQNKISTSGQGYLPPIETNKENDHYQTMKYPSDNEDNPGGPKDPGIL